MCNSAAAAQQLVGIGWPFVFIKCRISLIFMFKSYNERKKESMIHPKQYITKTVDDHKYRVAQISKPPIKKRTWS